VNTDTPMTKKALKPLPLIKLYGFHFIWHIVLSNAFP
jgi:hypothetical protein